MTLKEKTINGLFWSSIERFSVQGVSFVLGLIIARILNPEVYGIVAMLSIFLAISNTFIDSGFSTALIRKIDRTETDNATAFYFNIGVGAIAYLVLFVASPFIARFYDMPILSPVTKVLAFTLFLNSLCVVQQAILTARIDFKTQAKISLTAAVLSGLTGVVMAYKGYGVWALVVQTILSSLVRTILLWVLVKWKPVKPFSGKSFKELFSFGSKLLASGLLDTTYNNLYTIIIGKFFSAVSLGVYSRASQFAQMPSSNITGIIQRVTFPVLCTIQDEDERLRENYRKMIRLTAFIVFPLMVGLAAVADPLIRFLLTDKWQGAIVLLQVICFALMWYPIHAMNLNVLQVKGRSDLFLKLEVIKKIIGTSILCMTVPLGLVAMCCGQVVSSLICLAVNIYYSGKLIRFGFFAQMKDLMPVLFQSFLMGGIVFYTIRFVSSNGLKLVVGVAMGIFLYILISLLFKSKEYQTLLEIVLKKKVLLQRKNDATDYSDDNRKNNP